VEEEIVMTVKEAQKLIMKYRLVVVKLTLNVAIKEAVLKLTNLHISSKTSLNSASI